jgi:hypothetical protein
MWPSALEIVARDFALVGGHGRIAVSLVAALRHLLASSCRMRHAPNLLLRRVIAGALPEAFVEWEACARWDATAPTQH